MKLLCEFCNEKYFKNSHNDFFALEAYAEGNKNLPKNSSVLFCLSVQKVENPILLHVLTQQNKYLQGLENLHYTPDQNYVM